MSDGWGVGTKTTAKAFDTATMQDGTVVDLIFGEHPHSRQDNTIYARWADGRIEGFDGHRIRTRVELEEWNYLKMSGLSGNEVREGGTARILFNDREVYSFFFRRIEVALLRAHRLVEELKEHPSRVWEADATGRSALLGRAIYYRDVPATITAFWPDQGAVLIEPVSGRSFPRPVWAEAGEDDGDRAVKDDLLSPHIWWFRDDRASDKPR